MTEETQIEFAARVERDYGVRIDSYQFYADRHGRVYAGSEYVARVKFADASPDYATDWAETIAHMPRGKRGVEVATKNPHAETLAAMSDTAIKYQLTRGAFGGAQRAAIVAEARKRGLFA